MQYEKPKLELVNFLTQDIICTSTPDTGWGGDNDDFVEM